MSLRHVCVHGHFYQPPRENPWLEAVERQESAHPYHDWNQRVTAECYAPNAASRILDGRKRIVEIVNNYSQISFNFGPTLLSWMESNTRFTYDAILEADRLSRERFGGHGSAMAQAYGHMIMPLADGRDKRTQVLWGIRDFRERFGRDPEGMWLPETAVDLESLDIMAEQGIAFTVLAPHQAAAVRPLDEGATDGGPATDEGGGKDGDGTNGGGVGDDGEGTAEGGSWRDVSGGDVDPSRPYLVRLPSGRTITVFFYDGPISRAVAFEDLLRNGERLADRLLGGLPAEPDRPRLVHIATDGETFGHHHTHGEMALSYALERIREASDVELTNYSQFLEAHPPRHEARIVEDSSWSCSHGVERWRADCGCSTGARPGWSQAWRRPLRQALDHLRSALDPRYEEAAGELLCDPWAARDDYVRVLLDRSPETVDAFLAEHSDRDLSDQEQIRALELLELQRHAMLMYTSCGWFFADISGIETVQVLLYAGRAIQLGEDLFDAVLEEPFLERLAAARSNLPEKGNGRDVYEASVRPARVDLANVAAHYAIRSLFDPYDGDDDETAIYCYRAALGDRHTVEVGRSKLHVGWARFRSDVTREAARLSFAAVHAGDHNILGGVRGFQGSEDYRAVGRQLEEAFNRGELPEVVRILDREYRTPAYSLRSLFRDEQRAILDRIFESSVHEAETVLSDLYRERASLMRFVAELGIPQPRVFQVAAEFVLDAGIRDALGGDELELDRVEELLAQAREGNVRLDPDEIGYAARKALERLADGMADEPTNLERLRALERGVDLLLDLDFEVNIWGAQNSFYRALQESFAERAGKAEEGDGAAKQWVERFRRVGEKLSVAVP